MGGGKETAGAVSPSRFSGPWYEEDRTSRVWSCRMPWLVVGRLSPFQYIPDTNPE